MSRGVALILNRIRYTGQIPFEIEPGIVFDQATREESRRIAQFISSGGLAPFGRLEYFTAIPREPGERGTYDYQLVGLSEVEFWVLRFEECHKCQKWVQAFQLNDPEIEWSAYLYGGGMSIDPPRAFHYFQTNHGPYYTDLNERHLRETQSIKTQLETMYGQKGTDQGKPEILGVLDNFRSSRAYIRIGHMALLSHFTIIEGLLTHLPSATAGDSLNHQLSTKIPLLFRRIGEAPDYKQFFGDQMGLAKLWKRLYDVRSAFAHGGRPDLKGLKSFDDVQRYVYLSMKALLRLALREPELIYDLRAC